MSESKEELQDLMGRVFRGTGLNGCALAEFEAAAKRFHYPADVIYAIYEWGTENPQEPGSDFIQGEVAAAFGEQALMRLGIDPGTGGGANAQMTNLLDEIFENVGL